MLPKSQKLNTKQFSAVFETGKTVHGDFFMVKWIDAPDSEGFRAGVSVSKKYIKTAVGRNKRKRQVFAALHHYTNKNMWMVFVLKKEGVGFSFGELESDIEKIFKKINT